MGTEVNFGRFRQKRDFFRRYCLAHNTFRRAGESGPERGWEQVTLGSRHRHISQARPVRWYLDSMGYLRLVVPLSLENCVPF